MGIYTVKFYPGDYDERQRQANLDKAVCYFEQHFNAAESPTADYTCCVVGKNASPTSLAWGDDYTDRCAKAFSIKQVNKTGVLVGGWHGRGNYNLIFTDMPALLGEPLIVSNPLEARLVKSEEGRRRLAQILVDSIRKFFPHGGLVAFSVGHKYKRLNPDDRGAAVYGGGTEAFYAELVLVQAKKILETI